MAESWKNIPVGDGDEYELRAADHRVETDPKAVQWRFNELVKAGYTSAEANALSTNADVDLHAAIRYVKQGCRTDLACRIFGVDVDYDADPGALLLAAA